MVVLGVIMFVIAAYMRHGLAWQTFALAGSILLAGAIVFHIFWGATSRDGISVPAFWDSFTETNSVSKNMFLLALVFLAVAVFIGQVDREATVVVNLTGWLGAGLLFFAVIVRLLWNR